MTATVYTDDRAEILDRVDLAALWPDLVGPHGRNRQWPCPNPQHAQTGATPPVSINRDGTLWHCHGCDAGGTLIDLLGYTDDYTVAEAFTAARRIAGLAEYTAAPARPRPVDPSPAANPTADRVSGPDAAAFLGRYLDHRQWPQSVVDAFGLHVVRDTRGTPRVRHPYRSGGRTVWWQDRGTGTPKWTSPTGGHRMLYARDLADALDAPAPTGYDRPVRFVAEGPADVIALWCVAPDAAAVGIPGASGVAQWAEAFTGADVLIATDADDAGDRAAVELGDALAPHGARWARLRPPDGLDLDEWRRQIGDDDLRAALVDKLESEVWR